MKLNKPQFIKLIEDNMGDVLEHEDSNFVSDALDALFAIICDELAKGNEVRIHKFGCFRRSTRERAHRNPRTGEHLGTKLEHYVIFSPFSELVEEID